ncbi:MAG: EF-P lysine aminoacylase EpmA [Woeseiaceae bacterium]|nr:EF-P lysine aminoacylase EpmA [Woeseiaceae bacterium]
MTGWQPYCGAEVMRRRAALLERAQEYFREHLVMPVDVPALGAAGVTDPNIETLGTTGGTYLQTSPEFYMKRLLAAGYPDIYSIGRVFRDGEHGRQHLTEFTMIEWYRLGMSLTEIITDTVQLIGCMLGQRDLAASVERHDYAHLVRTRCHVDPLAADSAELAAACDADDELQRALGDDRDAWLDCLLATRVAPQLPAGKLSVIAHFPVSQAALARVCPADARVADRFEVFLGPVELANGYVELTDAKVQARRMRADNEKRRRLGRPEMAIDENLLAALEHGMPECAGVALGFERLHMVAEGASDIRDVICFADR